MDNNNDAVMKIDLIRLIHNVIRGIKKFLLLIVCLATLLGGVMGIRAWRSYVPMYKSEAVFSVSTNAVNSTDVFGYSYYYDNTAAKQAAELFPYILHSNAMTERLKLALDSEYIGGSISASSIADTNLFTLTVTSTSAEESLRILKAVIEVYPQMSYLMSGDVQLKMTQEPTMGTAPYNSRNWKESALKGALLGAAIGAVALLIWAIMQKTICDADEVKSFLNLTYLGSVPVIKARRSQLDDKLVTVDTVSADSQFGEAFRSIRMKLAKKLSEESSKVIMFTSTLQDEGKTTIAANTAITLAKDGHRVVLVDGDLRNPSIKKLLGITKETDGLGEYLQRDKIKNMNFIHDRETNLCILAGDAKEYDMNRIFNRARLEQIVENLADNFDYVIFDAPPCAVTADAIKLCRYMQKVVYIIRQDYASQSQIYSSVQSLYDNGADVCGFIINYKTGKSGIEKYNYGYKYGYGYGYGKKYGYGYGSGKKSRYGHKENNSGE